MCRGFTGTFVVLNMDFMISKPGFHIISSITTAQILHSSSLIYHNFGLQSMGEQASRSLAADFTFGSRYDILSLVSSLLKDS